MSVIGTKSYDELYEAFQVVANINWRRAQRWHGESAQWSVLEWAGAMCGEAGEVANVAKKILRARQGINPEAKGGNHTILELRAKLGEEIADTFLYLSILAMNEGIDIYDEIAKKFNAVSVRDGFPERLPEIE